MVSILINKHPGCTINKSELENRLATLFDKSGIVSDIKVSIALVNVKEMLDLSKKYLKDNKVHNVLTFPNSEVSVDFKLPPDKAINLGEIIICVPEAAKEGELEGVSTDEKVMSLAEHGAMHLIGNHHD